MNWDKILTTLKIPLRVLLPATWLFSGLFIFANEEVLIALGMLQWKIENSFVFGLLFSISSCLMVVYILLFIKEKVANFVSKITFNNKLSKTLEKLNDTEMEIIMTLYKSMGYTNVLDYNDPVAKGLLARNFIYMGDNQVVTMGWDNTIPARFSLQPFVYQKLDKELEMLQKSIEVTKQKIAKTKSDHKREELQGKLSELLQCWKNYEDFEV